MKNIKKTFVCTTLRGAVVYGHAGAVEYDDIDETVTTFEKVTPKNEVAVFLRGLADPSAYKGKTIVINDRHAENVTFSMSIDDFMKYGTAVEVEHTADEFLAE